MSKKIMFLLAMLVAAESHAQYYFKDILSNRQLMDDMAAYQQRKIRKISIFSFEANGEPSTGFFCDKKISKDYREMTLFTRSSISSASELRSFFNEKGQLLRTSDSSEISVTETRYQYDETGRLSSIYSVIRSKDDDFVTEIREDHQYRYEQGQQPVSMLRIRNGNDSTQILFSLDDQQNVSIEKDTKNGSKYYYYYNGKQKLTDIVHSNDFRQSLIPDYQFEYNGAGQMTQMISIEEGAKDYLVWKYQYEDGLRKREKVYSKDRKLLGSLEYEYK